MANKNPIAALYFEAKYQLRLLGLYKKKVNPIKTQRNLHISLACVVNASVCLLALLRRKIFIYFTD